MEYTKLPNPVCRKIGELVLTEVVEYQLRHPDRPDDPPIRVSMLAEEGKPADWIDAGPLLLPVSEALMLATAIITAAREYEKLVAPQPDTPPDVGASTEGEDGIGPSGPD